MANKNAGFLARLESQTLDRLTREAVRKTYVDGQVIHSRGEKRPGFGMIRQGKVRIGSVGPNGSFIEFGILQAGDVFGEMTVVNGIDRLHESCAVGIAVIDHVAPERFKRIVNEHPDLQAYLLRLLAWRLQHAYVRIDRILRLPLMERVALHIYENYLRHPDEGGIVIRQVELAEAMAASRVSISKALTRLNALGFITTGYGRITIQNLDGLKNWIEVRGHLDS